MWWGHLGCSLCNLCLNMALKIPPVKLPAANVTEDYQEYFCQEKVVAKKVTGGNFVRGFNQPCCYHLILQFSKLISLMISAPPVTKQVCPQNQYTVGVEFTSQSRCCRHSHLEFFVFFFSQNSCKYGIDPLEIPTQRELPPQAQVLHADN